MESNYLNKQRTYWDSWLEVRLWNRKEESLTEDKGIEGKNFHTQECVLAAWREEKDNGGASRMPEVIVPATFSVGVVD